MICRRRPTGRRRCTCSPMPRLTLRVSTTRTGMTSATSRAAARADSMVADSLDDRFRHTTPSAPSSARRRKAADERPRGGGGRRRQLTRGSGTRPKNPRARPRSHPRLPTRMVRGTMVSRCSAMTSPGRSQALSATTRIPGMLAVLPWGWASAEKVRTGGGTGQDRAAPPSGHHAGLAVRRRRTASISRTPRNRHAAR